MKTHILELVKRYEELVHSKRNQARKRYWDRSEEWNRDMWRGIPREPGLYTIALDNSMWGKLMHVNLRDYYSDPEVYLETQLKYRIYQFENFDDCSYYTDELFIWFGVITELSFFGADIEFYAHKEGWISSALLREPEALDQLEPPDFYKSGLMPRIHEYYKVMGEYAGERLKVMFPGWMRGPFCHAAHLRGFENLLMDTICEPEYVHRLMRFLVDSNKSWTAQRDQYLGTQTRSCKLFNDEIGSPTISSQVYRDFVLPYETELANHYGEVAYWHSCGDTTEFVADIVTLPNLRMFHCGPWTDYRKASPHMKDIALDICLNPMTDIVEADEGRMAAKLVDIADACRGIDYSIKADGIMGDMNEKMALDKLNSWIALARAFFEAARD